MLEYLQHKWNVSKVSEDWETKKYYYLRNVHNFSSLQNNPRLKLTFIVAQELNKNKGHCLLITVYGSGSILGQLEEEQLWHTWVDF